LAGEEWRGRKIRRAGNGSGQPRRRFFEKRPRFFSAFACVGTKIRSENRSGRPAGDEVSGLAQQIFRFPIRRGRTRIGERPDAIEKSAAFFIVFCRELKPGSIEEGNAHFLELQKFGKSRVHLSRKHRITLKVLRSKSRGHPLAGAKAVEGIAPLIAKIFEPIMDAAAETGLVEMVAGGAGELVVAKAVLAIEPERDAAEPDASGAVSFKIGMIQNALRTLRASERQKAPAFWAGAFWDEIV